jgi:hypothetical protein
MSGSSPLIAADSDFNQRFVGWVSAIDGSDADDFGYLK